MNTAARQYARKCILRSQKSVHRKWAMKAYATWPIKSNSISPFKSDTKMSMYSCADSKDMQAWRRGNTVFPKKTCKKYQGRSYEQPWFAVSGVCYWFVGRMVNERTIIGVSGSSWLAVYKPITVPVKQRPDSSVATKRVETWPMAAGSLSSIE